MRIPLRLAVKKALFVGAAKSTPRAHPYTLPRSRNLPLVVVTMDGASFPIAAIGERERQQQHRLHILEMAKKACPEVTLVQEFNPMVQLCAGEARNTIIASREA